MEVIQFTFLGRKIIEKALENAQQDSPASLQLLPAAVYVVEN